MIPTNESFKPRNEARAHVNLWLGKQEKLVPCERLAQSVFNAQALSNAVVHPVGEDADAVHAVFPRAGDCNIRGLHQRIAVFPILRKYADSQVAKHIQGMAKE